MATQEENDLLTAQQKLTEQLLQSMRALTQATNEFTAAQGKQADVNRAVNESIQNNVDSTNSQESASQQLNNAMKNSVEGTEALANALGRNQKQAQQSKKSIDLLKITTNSLAKAMEATRATAGLFYDAFKVGGSIIQGAIGVATGLFDSLMDVAADYYNSAAGEIVQANKQIQESFGELNKYQGLAVKEMYQGIRSLDNSYAKTGVSIYNTIGSIGRVMEEFRKVAESLGNVFVAMQDTVKNTVDEYLVMNKAMLMSEESYKQLLSTAKATGGDLEQTFKDTMVASVGLSKEFGVSVKVIGKNMDKMTKDFAHFGGMAPKELAAVATYATKLGVEIENLTSIVDKFDTFDSAAESAGKLAEVFGMNIDVMTMMNSNPAEQIDQLRAAFEATGKSVGDLSRHEMKMFQDTLNLTADQAQQMFSTPVDEMSFDDFTAAAEEAAEKLTPEQAMKDMADAITKLNEHISQLGKGPLASFINGFMHAVNLSGEFRAILQNIGDWLKVFMNAGKAVGKMFAEIVLGSSKIKGFIDNMFNVTQAEAFMTKVKGAFKSFFEMLATDPAKAVEDFLTQMYDGMKGFFSGNKLSGLSGLGGMIKEMFIGAFKFLAKTAPQIIKDISKYIIDLTQTIGDFMNNDNKVSSNIGAGLGGALMNAVGEIWKVMKSDLLPALGGLLKELFWQLAPIIVPVLGLVFASVFITSIVTGVVSAMASAAVTGALAGLSKMLSGLFKGSEEQQQNTINLTEGAVDGLNTIVEKLQDTGGVQTAIKNMAKLVVFAGVSMVAMSGAMWAVSKILGTLNWEELAKGIAGLTVATIATITLASFALLASKLDPANVMMGMGMVAAIATLGIPALAFGLKWGMDIMKEVNWDNVPVMMAALGVAVAAVTALGVVALGFGAMIAATGGLGVAAIIGGLVAVGAIAGLGLPIMAEGLSNFLKEYDKNPVDITKLTEVMMALGMAIGVLAEMIVLGMFAAGAFVGMGVAVAGLWLVDKFTGAAVSVISSMVGKLAKIEVADPENFGAITQVLQNVVGMVTDIGKMGIDAGRLAMETSVLAGADLKTTFDNISGFLDNIMDRIIGPNGIISKIQVLANDPKLTKEKLEKMAPLANMLGAVAKLVGSLAAPMGQLASVKGAVSKNSNWFSESETEGDKTASIDKIIAGTVKFIDKLMGSQGNGVIFELIDKLQYMATRINDPKKFKTQTEGLINITNVAASMVDSIRKIAKSIQDDFDWNSMTMTFAKFSDFIGSALPSLFTGINSVELTGKVDEAKFKTIKNNIDGVTKLYDSIKTSITDFIKVQSDLAVEFNKMDSIIHPSAVMTALVAETEKVAELMNNLEVSTSAKVTNARHLLGFDGSRTFKVKPEAVNVTVNLQVKMDAEELAFSIAKGNKKQKGFFQRTAEANDMLLEDLGKNYFD